MGRDRCAGRIGDVEAGIDPVAAAVEGEYLGHGDAVRAGRGHLQFDRVLALSQLQLAFRQLVHRLVRRQAGADQAALCVIEVATVAAIVQQHEIAFRFRTRLVLQQFKTDERTAFGRYIGDEQVGLNPGRRLLGRSCCLLRYVGRCRRCAYGRHRRLGACRLCGRSCSCRRCGRLVRTLPAVPQHEYGKEKNDQQGGALGIHRRSRVKVGRWRQGTGS